MFTLANKKQNQFILTAVNKNHNIKGFEQYKTPYSIFNYDYNNYVMVMGDEFDGNEFSRAIIKFLSSQTKNKFDIDAESFINSSSKNNHNKLIAILVDAVYYACSLPWTKNKNNIENQPNHTLVVSDTNDPLINEYLNIAKDKTYVRQMQDMPSNLMTPGEFERMAISLLKDTPNVKLSVLDVNELSKKNMNLLLAVGQGAQKPDDLPRLLIAEYLPNKTDKNIKGFVGKGVCFDTGGLNIKPGIHMRWMKYDMSGAAIVLGLIHSIAKNNLQKNVIVAMPLVLNLADSISYRPDDVIVGHSGLSVEIDNTDAEGRLILADSISYLARDIKVSEIYDIATLTGAMIYALGDTYTGVWSTNDEIYNNVVSAANLSGELVWRLPFHHDFKDLLKSKYADIANSVNIPKGGSSQAAMFLKEFTNNIPYTHFDVAGTADKDNTGTAVMLHTFYNIVKNN